MTGARVYTPKGYYRAGEVHSIGLQRVRRGMTPTKPSRPLFGYRIKCSCGWKATVNGPKPEAQKAVDAHTRPLKLPR